MSTFGRVASHLTALFKSPSAPRAARPDDLQQILTTAARRLGVPGAAAAISSAGERASAATGVLNVATKARVTPDSLFLIGSISKLWTATLVMQLVDEGVAALDDPVRRHVPALQLATTDATNAVTIRHLLTHTAGLEEDFMVAAGDRGDGCVRRYVEKIPEFGQVHPVGALYSYCNSGFVLAGHVLERARGVVYEDVVRAGIVERLALRDTVLLPEEALLRATAVGHVPHNARLEIAPVWSLPRAFGPAGATIAASAPDVLRFAEAHLGDGIAPEGRQLLSSASAREMQRPQVALPGASTIDDASSGLAWMMNKREGVQLLYHAGLNVGQHCAVLIVPQRRLAIVSLTNSVHGAGLHVALFRRFLADLPAEPRSPARAEYDPRRFVGRYRRRDAEVVVSTSSDGLVCHVAYTSAAYGWYGYDVALAERRAPTPMTPIDDWSFALEGSSESGFGADTVVFVDIDDDGVADYVYIGLAAARRVS